MISSFPKFEVGLFERRFCGRQADVFGCLMLLVFHS